MNVAVLSDIHGNAYALIEVLKVAKQLDVEKIFILGDVVGYYYEPDIVLELLDEWDTIFIRGNHEELLEKIITGKLSLENSIIKYGSGLKIALEKLSNEQVKRLISLPDNRKILTDDTSFELYHGSPIERDMYLYPDTDPELLSKCDSNSEFVMIGHSHYEFIYRNQNSLLVNVGSVGQSKTKGGVACWGIVNTISKTVKIMHTPYSVNELINQVESIDPDVTYLKTILSR